MKKKILVLQFRTDMSLQHERDCIVTIGNFEKNDFHFMNVLDIHDTLPEVSDLGVYAGIIMGGSGQLDISCWTKENKSNVVRIQPLVQYTVDKDIPMLNICFGHQLLAYFLGGHVEADTKQAETGTCSIRLTKEGIDSQLFRGIPSSFYAVLGHKDTVTKAPDGAIILAYSDVCGIESYQIKNHIYGVQFHPELTKEGMKYRLNLFPEYAKKGGIDKILSSYKETPFAIQVLHNFKNICFGNSVD